MTKKQLVRTYLILSLQYFFTFTKDEKKREEICFRKVHIYFSRSYSQITPTWKDIGRLTSLRPTRQLLPILLTVISTCTVYSCMPFNSKFVFILNLSVLSHPSKNLVVIRTTTGALYFHCCNLEFVLAVLFYSFTTTAGLLFLQLITSTYWLLVL